jgi:hypothetical protein
MLTDKDKQQLKQHIQANKHEVFVISIQEMDAIVKSSPRANNKYLQQKWQKIRDKAELGASYYASADDMVTVAKLVGDLGGFATNAYIKNYGGKPHIILKGYPGLRKILTGTKYGIHNPKVVTMGLGKAGAINAAKSGGILSVVLLSAYRVIDYFLTDQATLSRLVGTLATEIVKVGIATGASIGAAYGMAAFGMAVAVGPILAVIAVGIITSMTLTALDNHYGITDRVVAGLDELGEDANDYIRAFNKGIRDKADAVTESIIDYAVEHTKRIIINTARHQLNRFLSLRPKAY